MNTVDKSQGVCKNPILEFGNLYPKKIRCSFCDKEGNCYFIGKCDNLEVIGDVRE